MKLKTGGYLVNEINRKKNKKIISKVIFKNSRIKLLEILNLSHLRPFILQIGWRWNSGVCTDPHRAGGFQTIEGELMDA